MSELHSEVVPLSGLVHAQRVPGWLVDARSVVSGLLFTAAVAVLGTALFTALLVLVVVASPLVGAFVLYAVARHRRLSRSRWPALRAA